MCHYPFLYQGNKMQAGKRDIQGIFNRSWNLLIPFFQRSYVWREEEWERFLSDMYDVCEQRQEYFLGSVILKKESEQIQNGIVVDGQQRLTTLVLFFKVLLLKQNKHQEFDVIFKKIDDGKTILIHNKNDQKSFEFILNMGLLQRLENPVNQVELCYNYFVDYLDEEKLVFGDLLKYIAFVAIELDFYENEQQIFDTINSLGVRLSTAELLKSHLFRNDEIEFYENYWQSIFEKDNETVKYWNKPFNKDGKPLIDMFLFSFLQIKSKDLSSRDRGGFGQIGNLLKSYKKFIPTIEDKTLFFYELEKCAEIFRKYLNPSIETERIVTQIDRINLIIFKGGLFSIIPYFIFVLMNLEHDEKSLNETLFVLESYLMRRMIGIDKGTLVAKDYTELFGVRLIVNNIISANALKIHFNGYKDGHLHFVPTDNDIKTLLKKKSQTQAKALLILYLLDNKIRQDKQLDILFGFKVYSVEYLMPIKWQRHWSQPIDENMRKIAIKTLGNMTITPQKLSGSLKESDWQTRIDGVGRAKGLMHFNHSYVIKPLLHRTQWTDDDIFANNERLAKLICEAWKL